MRGGTSANEKSVREAFGEPATRSDRELVWTMIAIAAVDVGAGVYVNVVGGRTAVAMFALAVYVGALLLQSLAVLRFRYSATKPYSVGGLFWLLTTVGVFLVWNLALFLFSVATGLWIHGTLLAFDITVVVGLVPLLFGIWKLGTKLRAVER